MTHDKDQIIYLTINQVITINTIQIRTFSPDEPVGVKESGLLESTLHRPKQSLFGEDANPSIYEKAAALTDSLAKNHAFYNANKRTALASLIIFLKLNGYKWTMDIVAEQDFIVDIVNHRYTFSKMASTIEEYSIKL